MRSIFILILILLQQQSTAQKIESLGAFRDINSDRYVRVNYENDLFYGTDKNYTQGLNLELVLPSIRKNPINHLFYQPKLSIIRYGLIVEHNSFTPDRYDLEEIQYGDRPFASTLTFKSFLIAIDTLKASRITSSLSLGVIGPNAFGNEVQTVIHEVTESSIPMGWKNQIKNDIVINYEIGYEKQLLKYRNLFSLQTNVNGELGTLLTNASVGFNTAFGIINAPFSSTTMRNSFALYIYAQPLIDIIGYDATLQGGLFNRKSPYTISSERIERFIGRLNFGIVFKLKSVYIEYSSTIQTKSISTGSASKWAGIKLGILL
ncbi:MAG: hypothetical protein COA32_09950 [Fluviicola sp.]|nr:MAG: hypothetical protein COA32_09950 [Fluviicola sp.]